MADWSTPVLTSTYVSVLDGLKNRDIDLAVQFSPTYSTATNVPTGAIRWNPTNGYWEIRGASTWAALQAKYMIDVDTLDGQHGAYYLDWANFTGVPTTFTPSTHTHDDRYYTETESDARFANKLVISGNSIKLQTFGSTDLSTITAPYATNAGTVGGYSVGQNLLTTSAVTFAGVTTTSLTLGATAITATATEINLLSGLTGGSVQTQLAGKQATITGAASTVVSSNLNTSRVVITDSSGKLADSLITSTQLLALAGITGTIQTQLDDKAPIASPTFTGTVTGPTLRLTTTTDVTLTSTGHAFQIGATTAENMAVDSNEIQVRNNGAASLLSLNPAGGNVTIGSSASTITIAGSISGDATLSSGFTASTKTYTASTSFTVDPSTSNFQTITNGGAFTITAPTVSGNYSIVLRVVNAAGAGAVTLSGFQRVTGSSFTTVSTDEFFVFITKLGANTLAHVVALQ